ncbi:peptidylprolyl isomerase [Archangium primigenium]|uniref:peptidylprolyl isomerase n=1 Tax=[Archangium] primigenium TaxID=2792470 RepID=UPI00195933E9|nr:peptidylprolyl isomerase [Archangium primigenium]MBM7116847.1 peptidylprolyl isomerase [Archangium primigenium]
MTSGFLVRRRLGWLVGLVGLVGCEDADTVARVGRASLTREDVGLARAGQSPSVRATPEQALEVLVDEALLAEEARRQGLTDEPTVKARLAAQSRALLANALFERTVAERVTEQALRERYAEERARLERREVHVAHVFARLTENADEATRRQAQARIHRAYARLAGGESFEAVARELSEDAVSAERGGDLGVVREGEVDAAFFTQAVGLVAGAWSKPFESPFGLHVVKALEAPRAVVPPFEEVRGKLETRAREEARTALLERLRGEISIRRHPERLAVPGEAK